MIWQDPPRGGPGHVFARHGNQQFTLGDALQVELSMAAWSAPVSDDPVTIAFHQRIGATPPLRTGAYTGTVAFTLSTTTP